MNPTSPSIPKSDQLRKDRWVRARISVVTCLLVLGFTGVTWRLIYLHIDQRARSSALAAQMRQTHQEIPAHRGSIRDRNGELLAHDRTVYDLYADRFHLREMHLISRKLAAIQATTSTALRKTKSNEQIFDEYYHHIAAKLSGPLGMPAESVLALVKSTKPETVLCKDIEDEDVARWKQIFEQEQITGLYLRPSTQRAYPSTDRLTHVLGDVTYANQGNWGVEAMMDEQLKGRNGERWIERDNKGRELPLYRGKVVEAEHGHDVHLTIDMHLQEELESVLEQQCAIYTPRKAIIVLTDPKTGSVLAMASRPHYERDAKSGMWRNLAISDPYEPGSTFKIVALCAALDLGKASLSTEFFCHNGFYEEPGLKLKLRDDESFGTLRVEDVFAHSSNIGTYKMAKSVGSDDFLAYAWRFGFGQNTGIGLKGEKPGYLNTDNWTGTTFSRMAMGYEVSVTPIQLAMAVGAIANGGVLMKPRIVDRVVSADGTEVRPFAPQPKHQICKARTAELMKQAMMRVVTEGTGKLAAIKNVAVAGKTGTSQRYDEDLKRYVEGQYNTSFVGFAPADDPKVVCVVMMDNPKAEKNALYGGKVAAPIFAEIVKEALDHLSVDFQRPIKVRLADKGGAPP
jgi:cell division protein FtsI/penicillin-binding protein 2